MWIDTGCFKRLARVTYGRRGECPQNDSLADGYCSDVCTSQPP